MSTAATVGERLVGTRGRSLSRWARGRRHDLLVERFPELPEMRVLDLGGSPHSWQEVSVRPREVVLLNVDWVVAMQAPEIAEDGSWISMVAGDACDPPEELRNERFDLVFSNSVIEHVGGHRQRQAFAHHARALGEHYWIQTPSRGFPVEPHQLFPGFQFLPPAVRAQIVLRWPLNRGIPPSWTVEQALDYVLDIELLGATQMRFYFPDGELVRERLAGLTKSLIAVR